MLQRLPSVDQVLRTPTVAPAVERFGRSAVVDAIRATLASARASGHVAASDEVAADVSRGAEDDERLPRPPDDPWKRRFGSRAPHRLVPRLGSLHDLFKTAR